jgi:hypothetical protein
VSGPVEDVTRKIDQLKGWSQRHKRGAPAQYDRATVDSQPQQLYEQVLKMVQDSSSSKGGGVSTLTCDDLCLLASRLPVLMQLLGSKGSVLPAASDIARHAADSLQQGNLPTTPRFWSELLYGLTKAGLVVDTETNASQTTKQQTNIHLQQLLDEGVRRLPSLLASKGAAAQDVSMTLLAYAYAGYAGDLGAVVQAVEKDLDRCLQRPAPQGIANILWALGKLCDMGGTTHQQPGVQSSAYSQLVFSHALQQLTSFLHAGNTGLTFQGISNAVYGCALAGHMEGLPQFLAQVCEQPGSMDRATPQGWSNTVWGIATLYEAAAADGIMQLAVDLQQYGQLLLARCVQTPDVMGGATPQAWGNTVWAAAKLECVQEGALLISQLTSNLDVMRTAKPQEWSNSIWAAATLYEAASIAGDKHLAQQLQLNGHTLLRKCLQKWATFKGASPQHWANTLWAAAKLGCVQEGFQLLIQLTSNPDAMRTAKPQEWSNSIWGAATLFEAASIAGDKHLALQLQLNGHTLLRECLQRWGTLKGAVPQAWANTVWAASRLGCVEEGAQLLSQLTSNPDAMRGASVQGWSNTTWAAATLYEAASIAGDKHLAQQLQLNGHTLLKKCLQMWGTLKGAVPQSWANIVWAAARLGCVEEGDQLLSQLTGNLDVMRGALPQHWSNTLWAAATLYETAQNAGSKQLAQQLQQHGHTLVRRIATRLDTLRGATSQAWSNTLWAAATLRFYDQGLFSRAVQELSAVPSVALEPQGLSNALCACATCAHWGSNVQQLLGRVREFDLAQFNGQDLGNTAWAWAVLATLAQEGGSYEQHEQCFQQVAALLFKEAASRPVSSFTAEGRRQLYQAHLIAGYLGISGLPAGQVLEAAMHAGLITDTTISSRSQQEVHSALRQMGYTTQLEGLSPDCLIKADIAITALPDGSPCSIAVEVDGPSHYVTEQNASTAPADRLDGPTRLRNALLSRSFPDGLVCVYWRDWAAVQGNKEALQEYLSKALAKVVRDKVRGGRCSQKLCTPACLHCSVCTHSLYDTTINSRMAACT